MSFSGRARGTGAERTLTMEKPGQSISGIKTDEKDGGRVDRAERTCLQAEEQGNRQKAKEERQRRAICLSITEERREGER